MKLCAEWLVIAFGFATICVVLAFCLWRIATMNDQFARNEAMVHQVLGNQAGMIARQQEALDILRKLRGGRNP